MNLGVVGLQWGDEGKGKIVDYLAKDFDLDVRFQGGSNAGHTVHVEGKKYIFHLIPCGVLNKKVVGVIGAGCVFDPEVFFNELNDLKTYDLDIRHRIKVSKFCHLIMPYHILLDKIREESKQVIGTTKRGIGATYEDKYGRVGLRIGDLFDAESFKEKLRVNISRKNHLLMDIYHAEPLSDSEIYDKFMDFADRLKDMVVDDSRYVHEAIDAKKAIIFEGAQGALLDITYGTYPYVTSSHTISGSASIGCGVGPHQIQDVLGVVKAYTTRVGLGPFPTEDKEDTVLRDKGQEYGATTGRPRRCGPFDASVVKYSARLNGVKKIVLTKFDILSGVETLRIAVGYTNGKDFDPFIAQDLTPVYEELPGFKEDISAIRTFDALPDEAKDYVRMIERYTGLVVQYISIGPDRDAVIVKK
ncbi:adenylosuccinate synthase [candidate division WOR-3 bacterium]|nr:adenylosuccinate synthase [candidate division WOR-3 bacterium]